MKYPVGELPKHLAARYGSAEEAQKVANAYQNLFALADEEGSHAAVVLADLAMSCHQFNSTIDANPQITAFREGERNVWNRIQQCLSVTEDDFLEKETS